MGSALKVPCFRNLCQKQTIYLSPKCTAAIQFQTALPNDLTCQWNQDACEFHTFLHFGLLIDILAPFALNTLHLSLAACLNCETLKTQRTAPLSSNPWSLRGWRATELSSVMEEGRVQTIDLRRWQVCCYQAILLWNN